MLLTDGNPNGAEELRVYESGILGVAGAEMIDLSGKLGLATEEISLELMDFLLDRRAADISGVVVTRQLKRWHALHTLELVYRDAFNNQLNDRYKPKFEEYRGLSQSAKDQTLKFGVGMVGSPIPKAGTPVLSAAQGSLPAKTYYVQVSWMSWNGQEGAPSDPTTFDTSAGSVLVVGTIHPPVGATGFKVYVGLTPDSMMLQTPTPVAVGQSYTMTNAGVMSGVAPGTGQAPECYVSGSRILGTF